MRGARAPGRAGIATNRRVRKPTWQRWTQGQYIRGASCEAGGPQRTRSWRSRLRSRAHRQRRSSATCATTIGRFARQTRRSAALSFIGMPRVQSRPGRAALSRRMPSDRPRGFVPSEQRRRWRKPSCRAFDTSGRHPHSSGQYGDRDSPIIHSVPKFRSPQTLNPGRLRTEPSRRSVQTSWGNKLIGRSIA